MKPKMTTLFKFLISAAVCAYSTQVLHAEDTKLPYWKDIQTVAVNKEYPRTAFMTYDNRNQALTGEYENSPYYKLLNGTWNFYYADAYKDLPANIEQPDANIAWKEIKVPGNWEVQGYGVAIYTMDTNSNPEIHNRRSYPKPIRSVCISVISKFPPIGMDATYSSVWKEQNPVYTCMSTDRKWDTAKTPRIRQNS